MPQTSFWLIRHALVEENARAMLYGVMDVPLCETTLLEQAPMYRALANRLPRWMQDAKNRADILKCMERLREKL